MCENICFKVFVEEKQWAGGVSRELLEERLLDAVASLRQCSSENFALRRSLEQAVEAAGCGFVSMSKPDHRDLGGVLRLHFFQKQAQIPTTGGTGASLALAPWQGFLGFSSLLLGGGKKQRFLQPY